MLFDRVNKYRKDSGKSEMFYSKDAYFLSKIQAEWMYKYNKFSHNREDTFYNKENVKFFDPYKRCRYYFGLKYIFAGENITRIDKSYNLSDEQIAEYSFLAFEESPGHRFSMLDEYNNGKFYGGFCTYETPKYVYVVQTFLFPLK